MNGLIPSFLACRRPPKRRAPCSRHNQKPGCPDYGTSLHFLPLRGHQHGRNIDGPTVRTRKITFSLLRRISSMISSPSSQRAAEFSPARVLPTQPSLHRLRRGGKHLIYNRFAFSFTRSGKQSDRLINARRRELFPIVRQNVPAVPEWDHGTLAALSDTRHRCHAQPCSPVARVAKDLSNSGMYSLLFFFVSMLFRFG